MKTVGVAILGLGVVGSGTYRILTEHREFYRRTQDIDVNVECVLEINRERALALGIEPQKICGNIAEIVSNPNVDIVVEVIGGVEPAKSFVLAALHSGKTVVTSNKELFCKYWYELEAAALVAVESIVKPLATVNVEACSTTIPPWLGASPV